jgi:hypothetical protein
MPDRNATDLHLGRDAHPPDEPTPADHGDRVAVAPDGGAGGWEAFDDPDAPSPPATTPDHPEPHTPPVTPAPDGGAGGWEAFDNPDAVTSDRWPADWQDDPDDLAGKSRAELEDLLQDWEQRPTTTEGGVRWFRPGSRDADVVRWMPGNPDDPNPIKQRPYIRASLHGDKYGPYPAG